MAGLSEQAAFVRQAASDFDAYQLVCELDLPACHRLHLLQMATEKLAKAIGLAASASGYGHTHVAFSKTLRVLRNTPRLAPALGMTAGAYRHFAARAFEIARMIEELHPQVPTSGVQNGANVEYPWESGEAWIAPCDHAFPVVERLSSPDGTRLVKLAHILVRDFDRWFT